ncbi:MULTISPECIES: hypothetical protein [Xanthobacter]|uniref:hypothetical protein n=1 Tax=Xanthobacter TaxID=279 RepID=UPI00372D154A
MPMRRINQERMTTFVVVIRNLDLARRSDRIVEMIDGRLTPSPGTRRLKQRAAVQQTHDARVDRRFGEHRTILATARSGN